MRRVRAEALESGKAVAKAEAPRRLREELRAAGLRATASRVAVLALLRRAKRPMSHAEVVARLGEQSWDKATLYRNLIDLTEAGLLRQVMLSGRVQRYEPATNEADDPLEHAHFVCVRCGDVQCLPGVQLALPDNLDELPGTVVSERVEVQLRGRCDACQDPAPPGQQ